MKKVILVVSALFIGSALADSTPTSVGYVDSQIGTLQNKISAVDTNTVLTTTNTAGEIGQKSIYDANGNYATQTDALVTAEVANAAVQNAIDTEFICTEWLDGAEHTNENCLIYEIRAAKLALLPTSYTPLEYIESTGTQRIDSDIFPTQDTGVLIKYSFQKLAAQTYIFGTYTPHYYLGITSDNYMAASYGPVAGNVVIFTPIQNVQTNMPYVLSLNYNNSRIAEFVGIQKVNMANKTFSSNVGLLLFGVKGATGAGLSKSRIYYMQITDGTSLVRDFIPARRESDGEVGMYDLVSNTFFTNAGTGEFIAGPELNVYLPSGN